MPTARSPWELPADPPTEGPPHDQLLARLPSDDDSLIKLFTRFQKNNEFYFLTYLMYALEALDERGAETGAAGMTLKRPACHDVGVRHTQGKGERMTEDGILGIMKRGNIYQVRYASYNPHGMDRPSYQCPDEGTLVALLRRCGMDPWYIHQAGAELQKGGFAALPIALAEAQIQTYFSPQTCTAGEHEG